VVGFFVDLNIGQKNESINYFAAGFGLLARITVKIDFSI